MVSLTIITEPTLEPITLEEAKEAIGIDGDDDDLRIEGLIQSARIFAEDFCQLHIMSQVVERQYD